MDCSKDVASDALEVALQIWNRLKRLWDVKGLWMRVSAGSPWRLRSSERPSGLRFALQTQFIRAPLIGSVEGRLTSTNMLKQAPSPSRGARQIFHPDPFPISSPLTANVASPDLPPLEKCNCESWQMKSLIWSLGCGVLYWGAALLEEVHFHLSSPLLSTPTPPPPVWGRHIDYRGCDLRLRQRE